MRRPQRAAVYTAVVGVVAALSVAPAGATPDETPAEVRDRVERLYREAELSTEKYNAAATRATQLRDRLQQARERTAQGQERVNRLRDTLGRLAGAQYRSAGLAPSLTLLLSEDVEGFLGKAALLRRIRVQRAGRLAEFRRAQRALEQYRAEARRQLTELKRQRDRLERHKKAIQRDIGTARRLLEQLERQREEAEGGGRGHGTGPPQSAPSGETAPSPRAAAAVAAVRQAVGAPYAWGREGPHAFDCSGLTQWAYERAGVSIPRTSQAQRDAGRRIPLPRARPGDLVIYRSDASHVAMYVGGGRVVHAPHPGARVRYDPVDMMPVSAVVRP